MIFVELLKRALKEPFNESLQEPLKKPLYGFYGPGASVRISGGSLGEQPGSTAGAGCGCGAGVKSGSWV